MRFWELIRSILLRARAGAADVAQGASIRLDIRSLEGQRDHLFRDIGRRVYDQRGEGGRSSEFVETCAEITEVEAKLREKQETLRAMRTRPEEVPGAEPTGVHEASATSP